MTNKRVSEAAPVQVYLDASTRDRLERLVGNLGTSKSDVLRRGLVALERELSDPGAHPALRIAGLGASRSELELDAARRHDEVLAALHEPAPPPYGKAPSRGKKRG